MLTIIVTLFLTVPPFNGEYCTVEDRDFKGFRYEEQIPVCKRRVSTSRKKAICKRDGVTDRAEFKVDHIIPVSLGGNNSNRNLWCQHMSIDTANIEGYAYRMLNKGIWNRKEAMDFVRKYKFKLGN